MIGDFNQFNFCFKAENTICFQPKDIEWYRGNLQEQALIAIRRIDVGVDTFSLTLSENWLISGLFLDSCANIPPEQEREDREGADVDATASDSTEDPANLEMFNS